MDPALAVKLVSALDAESARREAKHDAEEDKRWRKERGDDPVVFWALWLDRFVKRIEKKAADPLPSWYVALSADDRELHKRRVEGLVKQISKITEIAERLEQHREDEANGIVRRMRSVAHGARSPHLS